MGNELTNIGRQLPETPIHQQAERIINIEHAGAVTTQNTIFFSSGLPGTPGYSVKPLSYSRDYYNLIVYGQDPLPESGHITLDKSRCLVESGSISPELKARFSPLSPEAIADLKSFLCIVAYENIHYGWTEETQYAYIAQLTDIKNRSNGIELYYRAILAVSQARLNEYAYQFGILGGYRKFNEFNRSHWTVKEIDLMEALNDTDLNPMRG